MQDPTPRYKLVMFQPPGTPLTIVDSVKSLTDYIDEDWSDEDIEYDWDDRSSCFTIGDNEPVQKPAPNRTISRVMSAVADIANKIFIRPWPNRHIDSKDPTQFVSREESEYRLLLLYIGCTIILSLTTTGLLITCPFYCINPEIIILYPKPESDPKMLKVPHVLIIYWNGSMIDFSTNEKLSPSKTVKMELSCYSHLNRGGDDRECSVLAYADTRKIFIFYGNTKRDLTEIDALTFKSRVIPNTKVKNEHDNGIGVQVGSRFLLMGGHYFHPGISHTDSMLNANLDRALHWSDKVDLWSVKRKKFIKGGTTGIPALVEYSCTASFNRSHFIIVNKPETNGNVSMFNIETWIETRLPRLPLPTVFFPNSYYDKNSGIEEIRAIQSRVACDIDFDKNSFKKLIAISRMHCEFGYVAKNECSQESDDISMMYQFNFETEEWSSQRTTNIKYFGTLKIVSGIKYFFNIFNIERHFGYYHEPRNDTWIELDKSGYSPFSEGDVFAQFKDRLDTKIQENVIAVPYFS